MLKENFVSNEEKIEINVSPLVIVKEHIEEEESKTQVEKNDFFFDE